MSHFSAMVRAGASHVRSDYQNFYSWPSLRNLLLGAGVAAVMANTRIDTDFHEWYQGDVQSRGSNHWADFWRPIGDGWYAIPAVAGAALIGECFADYRPMGVLGEFGGRATRAYLVGAPPLLVMQRALGGGRPAYGESSHWDSFEGSVAHGVSGHAFMGAVPFLTAANMVENPWAKGALFACSAMPAWSRVNDDRHYLSQVLMGWWLAYLSCAAVDETSQADRRFSVTPIITPEMNGMGIVYQR
jgi:membrane-associated phospholipid phosphatase